MKKPVCHLFVSVGSRLLVLLLLSTVNLIAAAPQEPTDSGSANSQSTTAASLPASRIIDILRQNPDLMQEVKQQGAEKLQEQGMMVTPSDITDDMVYQKIEQDPEARRLATQQLIQNGYVDKNDPDLGGKPNNARETDRHPSTKTTRVLNTQTIAPPSRDSESDKPDRVQSDNGEIKRKKPPYRGVPSLTDLYVQSVEPSDNKLKRFGLGLFDVRTSAGLGSQQTMDIPAGPEYVVGPGDELTIDTWGSVSRRISIVVDREGRVVLPEIGTVFVAGKSLAELREMVPKLLRTQFKNLEADVSLARLRSVRIYVVGEVQNPGAYDISSLSTVVNAISAAGGVTPNGSMRMIRHFRGQRLVKEFDTYDLLLQGTRPEPDRLEPGDTVLVPTIGPQVTVTGKVRRPAIYELKEEQTLDDALTLAGGVLVSGSLQQIRVERVEPHERRIMLSLDISSNDQASVAPPALRSFVLKDGDKISIAPIPTYSNETVYLEGHVLRPGKYPYKDGLTVSDLLASYKDLLPEPSDRAELIRLVPPEHQPKVMQFDLRSALDHKTSIPLEPFDTIRVFGRYETDAPKVSIYGEVLRPGEYPMSQDMNASDLVRLAGGFKRSAYRKAADLTSYNVIGGERVESDHRTMEIGSALDGTPDTDVRLKPGDVLSIRQISGWGDIGGSVTINGEVAYPGTYGIEQGERLSSILMRAGGLRSTAYPNGAVLEREQVRELDQKSRETLIRRVQSTMPLSKGNGAEQATVAGAFFQQQQQIVSRLKAAPISGRQVIRISADISKWKDTAADIEVRPGDTVFIPKRPDFVLVDGQVNSPSAITFAPGKDAHWYLRRAGGSTQSGDVKKAFIVKADGSVVGPGSVSGIWSGGPLSTILQPGDSVIVPEKIISDNSMWRSLLNTAQIVSSVAIAARVATSF